MDKKRLEIMFGIVSLYVMSLTALGVFSVLLKF